MSRFLCLSFCLFLLLLLPAEAAAQGFRLFSGRNHPELEWRVAETAHFKIIYPARLSGIAARAAPIAEASYAALSKNLGVTFDDRLRIYLSDADAIVNGFATPVGGGVTNIWVHVNDYAAVFTGPVKWLRKVIAHELTHLFHYRAVRSDLGLLAYAFGDPLPRFWAEGLAQYETELWDAERGERWLRTAILNNDLSYRDGRSIWNGRLLYALGNSQVRYLAAQRGDTTIAQILDHRSPVLFGLTRVHDFETAFREVTGQSYRDFFKEWRRHVNVYYNTLAGQLHPVDSLDAETLDVPGRYLYDMQFGPDTAQVAILSLLSPRRPVTRLHVLDQSTGEVMVVAEGPINAPVAWSPDGRHIAFSRLTRGTHGSLLYDLFLAGLSGAGGSDLRRLTHSRRAVSPTFSPSGDTLAFIASEGTTANVFLLNLTTGQVTPFTHFTGNVQLLSVRWQPGGQKLALACFAAGGTRQILLYDLATGTLTPVTSGAHDDRRPVWRPDGSALAYTSLRDEVPNVFVYDLQRGTHRRVTHQAVGATATGWLPPDSAHVQGQLVLLSTTSKTRDEAFLVHAGRTAPPVDVDLPEAYTGWTEVRPPHEVPAQIAPDASLITRRYAYDAWTNLSHVVSLALPYYFGPDDAGLFGLTTWTEPLGKHTFFFAGGLSVTDLEDSFFTTSYVNNQLYPTLAVSGYRLPGAARAYGQDLLVENVTGGHLSLHWPLAWTVAPYTRTTFETRLRYVNFTPLNLDTFLTPPGLAPPRAGEQLDLRLALTRRTLRPYRDNLVHPLDGRGGRLEVTGAARLLGTESQFLRGDLAAFQIFPSVGRHRLYLYGRAQAQTGDPLPQDFLGLTRYDNLQLAIPGFLPLTLGDNERVRGFRAFAAGNRVLFGTVEYRVPLADALDTELFGILSLGTTALAAFADAGAVWRGADLVTRRLGMGLEVKNALHVGRVFTVTHALGIAQPAAQLGADDYEVYYRIRAALPF